MKTHMRCLLLLHLRGHRKNETSTEKACTRRTAIVGTRSTPSVPVSCIASGRSHAVVLGATWVAGATRSHNMHGALISLALSRLVCSNSLRRVSIGSRGFNIPGLCRKIPRSNHRHRTQQQHCCQRSNVLGAPCTSLTPQLLWLLS